MSSLKRILDKYQADEFPESTTLRFYKKFEDTERLYPYAAMKGSGFWYITGQEGAFTWVSMWEFFERDNELTAECVFVATSYERVYELEE